MGPHGLTDSVERAVDYKMVSWFLARSSELRATWCLMRRAWRRARMN